MNSSYRLILFLVFTFVVVSATPSVAQPDIKVNNMKVNHLDNKKRKQGEWIFFDGDGNIKISCTFKNDRYDGPLIFYKNSDTAFVRINVRDSIESFIFYKDKKKYYGDFIHTSDTTTIIELESDTAITATITREINEYRNIVIEPVYGFAQINLKDYTSASIISSGILLNKQFYVLLTISNAGLVTNVEFPPGWNNLSASEERELHWIYSTMPRWQPYFYHNRPEDCRIMISNTAAVSLLSFK